MRTNKTDFLLGLIDRYCSGDVTRSNLEAQIRAAVTAAPPAQPQEPVAELLREAHGQIRHLIEDLTTAEDDGGLVRYVPKSTLMFSNLIGALHTLAPKMEAALAASPSRALEPLPPIERDEHMDRTYIPLPGGWEVQTKGKGSTFRICDTKSGDRWPVMDHFLHEMLERMAREIRTAVAPAQPLNERASEFVRLVREAVAASKAAPIGTAVRLPPALTAEFHKFLRDEPSAFDDIPGGEFRALAPVADPQGPQERPALVSALRGLLASLSRDPTEQELRAAAHEFTVRADRLAAARTHREDVDG